VTQLLRPRARVSQDNPKSERLIYRVCLKLNKLSYGTYGKRDGAQFVLSLWFLRLKTVHKVFIRRGSRCSFPLPFHERGREEEAREFAKDKKKGQRFT